MPPTESEGVLDDPALPDTEALSCVTCRARKLKCNRAKPACARCVKVRGDCVYPESRRKPAFKRKNVKELEARLAQVEVLLREVGTNPPPTNRPGDAADPDAAGLVSLDAADPDGAFDFGGMDLPESADFFLDGMDYTEPSAFPGAAAADAADPAGFRPFGGELMELGMSEPPPPFRVMEDLFHTFFQRQQHFIPVVNPPRFYQAFYSGSPHMKPPMCLQYAMFAMAAHTRDDYASSHEVFYHRARQYAEADEMKGSGEHFLTVAHAQAWVCIAVYEAKNMMFTRAAMSASRAVRLVEMMGLHRLDSAPTEISPTLLPPKDWSELEERRRTFWGVFCIESHCSVSTGWPSHINALEDYQATTHLPAPESAFATGQGVTTCTLGEALKGHTYHSFAGAVLVCHFFNEILKHIHQPRPGDRPDDYEHGAFWRRHRELDNALSSAFMFLPASFRLPDHYRDPAALHSNLNLHAAVICLHHAAIDKAGVHGLPDAVKKASQSRLLTAANEIVNIVKMISHVKANPKSPLSALALYCAGTVYIYQCRETRGGGAAGPADGLDFCVAALHAFAREHVMTRSFLRQLVLDVERNGVGGLAPALAALPPDLARGPHAIPLLARSAVSRHEAAPPPLPGRLPLGRPQGARTGCAALTDCGLAGFGRIREIESDTAAAAAAGPSPPDDDGDDGFPSSAGRHKRHKRRRSADTSPRDSHDSPIRWAYPGLSTDPSESTVSSRSTPPESQDAPSSVSSYPDPHTAAAAFPPPAFPPPGFPAHNLPHRIGSPVVSAGAILGDFRLPPTTGGIGASPGPFAAAADDDVASAWDFLGTTASATTVDWNAIYTASSGFDPGPPVAEGGTTH